MSADLGDGASPVIEEVTDDSGLRWMGRLFASTISGVTPQSVGTIAAQHEHDPDWVKLAMRDEDRRVIAALSSHLPLTLAQGAARFVDEDAGYQLALRTRVLEHLAVHPSHRGRGYARALLARAEELHRGQTDVDLWFGFLDERERGAAAFYDELGFIRVETPAELPAPAHVLEHATLVRRGQWFYKLLIAPSPTT